MYVNNDNSTLSESQIEGELGAVLLDADFARQLAISQGRQMLETGPESSIADINESLRWYGLMPHREKTLGTGVGDENLATSAVRKNLTRAMDRMRLKGMIGQAATARGGRGTGGAVASFGAIVNIAKHDTATTTSASSVSPIRAAEPTSLSRTDEGAAAEADRKGRTLESKREPGEEKPSWDEVLQITPEGSSLLSQATDGWVVSASQRKHIGHDETNAGDELASQIDGLQRSMIDMNVELNEAFNDACAVQRTAIKHDMNEAINEASAVQHSRMDSLQASLEAQSSEQSRISERLGEMELTMRRVEDLLLKSLKAGTTIVHGDDGR